MSDPIKLNHRVTNACVCGLKLGRSCSPAGGDPFPVAGPRARCGGTARGAAVRSGTLDIAIHAASMVLDKVEACRVYYVCNRILQLHLLDALRRVRSTMPDDSELEGKPEWYLALEGLINLRADRGPISAGGREGSFARVQAKTCHVLSGGGPGTVAHPRHRSSARPPPKASGRPMPIWMSPPRTPRRCNALFGR